MIDNNICIYRHIRLDTNEIFYIGIGDETRPNDKIRRTIWWKNITNKTEYEVQILKSDLTWEDACELEIILIAYYGRRDKGLGPLVNLTDGGEGAKGVVRTPEQRKRISEVHKGKIVSQETREKLRQFNLGKKLIGRRVICTKTNIIYDSIAEAARSIKTSRKNLSKQLANINSKTTFKYLENE